ncbi:MAG: HlyD family type I secretion periplasmic adaptor subunit [Pseudomonadota bacterium]
MANTIRKAMIFSAILVFGIGGLATFIPITGAIIASGSISVESAVKRIGHPFGGTVADILVEDGQRVEQDEPLIRLDTTVSSASSELTGLSVDQLLALEARLIAERDEAGSISFPEELLKRAEDPNVAAIMASERRNFSVRRQARSAQQAQLSRRAQQAAADISGFESQIQAFERQSELIDEELAQTRELYGDRLTTLDRLNALERSASGLDAQRDTAAASINQANARIAESRAQAASIAADGRSVAAAELVQVQAQLAELRRRQVAADDAFDRTVIRAPAAGIVDKLSYKTIGAVIPPGETILEIVPDSDDMIVQARVLPQDIDQVAMGSKATLLLSGLNRQTTPELEGKVSFVSADRALDENGNPYFRVNVEIPDDEIARLEGIELRVGMPVETYIQTGDRSLMSFITRPLMDQMRRSFRSN